MTKKIFITGTDTDAGKTFSACVLECKLRALGYKVRPYKPIVAGFENGQNADLQGHTRACGGELKPLDITVCTYEEPIAPHIAAVKTGKPITWEALDQGLEAGLKDKPDFLFTEGAGGWLLPLGEGRVLPDWPALKDMDVILVVGMKLGCLNHALLTALAIKQKGCKLVGYITCSPSVDKMPYFEENRATLKEMLQVPYLGDIPFTPSGDFAKVKADLDLAPLFNN